MGARRQVDGVQANPGRYRCVFLEGADREGRWMDNFENLSSLGGILYFVVGAPIAWRHMQEQKMTQSVSESPDSFFILMLIWPVLLFARSVVSHQEKQQAKRDNRSTTEPAASETGSSDEEPPEGPGRDQN